MGAKNSCSCYYCLGCFLCPRLQLPRGAPLGPYLLSPPSPLTGWPSQDSTVSHWWPTWGLHLGHLTSSSPQRWLKMNLHMIALAREEARRWKVLRGLGLPFLGAFSVTPPFSQLSAPHSLLGQFSFKDPAAFLFTPQLCQQLLFSLSLSLSPLFFF